MPQPCLPAGRLQAGAWPSAAPDPEPPARIDPLVRRLLYSARPRSRPESKGVAAMTEAEPEEVREKKGGKRKLLAFLALIGAVIAALAFWRHRGAEEEE